MSSSSLDLSPLSSLGNALKERKNFLIGAAAVVALTIVLVLFFKHRQQEAAYAPWRQLVGASSPTSPWLQTPEELGSLAAEIDDPEAKALALYWEALKMYSDPEGDAATKQAAIAKLEAFGKEFGDSSLWKTPFPSTNPLEKAVPPAERLRRQMRNYANASALSSRKEANDPPPAGNTVTLVTDQGEIVIALYTNLSPESCVALAQHAESLKGKFIANALEGLWVEVGSDVEGTAVDLEGVEGSFPPYEPNGLSFFEGVVAFKQAPYTDGPYNALMRVWLQENFRDDGRYTVLGQVSKGMDLLEELSKADKDEPTPGLLAEPVEITDVLLDLPDVSVPETDAEDPEDGAGSDEDPEGEDGGSEEGAEGTDEGGDGER